MEAVGEPCDFDERFTVGGMWARVPEDWGRSGAERAEILGALRQCLEELPGPMAELVWLRDLLGVPTDEVCKCLALTPTNLWTRMHRARTALRECVERRMGGEGGR